MIHQQEQIRTLKNIPANAIIPNPMQPRKTFDAKEILSLAESILQVGILQPLVVRYKNDGRYELVAGERRLRACKIAGIDCIPCIIVGLSESQSAIAALVENLQRKNLDFFEEAKGICKMMSVFSMTQSEAARKLGKSQSAVANKLRLLSIPLPLQKILLGNGLSERHARAVLCLSPEKMEQAIILAAEKRFTVQELEKYVLFLESGKRRHKRFVKGFCRDIRLYINTIDNAVGMMKHSGIKAVAEKEDLPDSLIYKIVIPKTSTLPGKRQLPG